MRIVLFNSRSRSHQFTRRVPMVMTFLRCHGSLSPFRALSSRPRCNLIRTHRTTQTQTSSPPTSQTLTTPTTWVDRLPPKVQPYIYLTRIDKPIGTLLLFYPCSASSPQSLEGAALGPHLTIPSLLQPGQSPWPHTPSTRPRPSL
jgi:hypothetical protein